MPVSQPPDPQFWDLAVAALIATIAGAVSILRRIVRGHPANLLWIATEFLTAILCGYLMYEAYPYLAPYLPDFLTLPISIALAAHSGGRVFQEAEDMLISHYKLFTNK